jgi:hypothetical protein
MPGRTKIALISRAAMRSVAVFAAVITLAGQLAAASHVHQAADPCGGVNAVAQVNADGGLCALCLLAFHTSGAPTVPVTAETPREHREAPSISRTERWTGVAIDTRFGRAPPAAL